MQEHIAHAQEESALYNNCIKEALENGSRHFTFDFSQNVNIPHHARQMGPLYFLSLPKIQIFGFRIDDIPKQLNFLIDEHETIDCDGTNTHGPDSVISMIDWSFSQYGTGDRKITIHADNCSGQNKNQFVIGYLMWRIMTGQQDEITYMMQVPGHTRCIIDGGFALIKKLYRRSDCDSIDQLERIVEQSSVANSTVRYPAWQWRERKAFLSEYFKPLKGIRKYHHFCFQSTEPGTVTVKESVSSEEMKINILKDRNCVFNQDRPAIIQPTGLSDARKQYLFTKVRLFVRPAQQDMTGRPPE
ncbi:uncharacterized protein LOC133180166 [Saccostrea echinata]|uniref:uncharacterized protein LOC133180166 n=1 Tax=Saccostrea echinata TaxID=191078 RepID=UPI002A83FBB8|nr:uncharacterized protein LOC133180166 [Saccostrea echinata]